MFLNFAAAIATLGTDAGYRIAAAARPPAAYLFNTLLPEENRTTYHIKSGEMTVRSMMAGLVGMDAPYPPTGLVDVSTFFEQSAKIANSVQMPEAAIRTLQAHLAAMGISQAASIEQLAQEGLNFLQKVIVQAHLDAMEWLRGQTLVFGEIDWTFNQKNLLVDYGVPVGNFLPARAGADGYGGATSQFWTDVRLLRRALRGNVRAFIAHSETVDAIRYNTVNQLVVTAQSDTSITFQRTVNNGASFSADAGDRIVIVIYDLEGEVMDPTDPNSSLILPFMPPGKLLAVGNNRASGYIVGQGSTNPAVSDTNRLGYTHIAPTVEGGGRPGRWTRMYVPENRPWEFRSDGVTNGLPVLEAPTKVAVATTDLP
jgi:hypothetical protein